MAAVWLGLHDESHATALDDHRITPFGGIQNFRELLPSSGRRVSLHVYIVKPAETTEETDEVAI